MMETHHAKLYIPSICGQGRKTNGYCRVYHKQIVGQLEYADAQNNRSMPNSLCLKIPFSLVVPQIKRRLFARNTTECCLGVF